MTRCTESVLRIHMTDGEFWAHVYPGPDADTLDHFNEYHVPDLWVIHCVRCQTFVEVDDPALHVHDAFCGQCADEMSPYPDYLPEELPL